MHGVSLRVAQSEIVAIMGRNGMGKSTLMKALIGIARTTAGSFGIASKDITGDKS